MSTFSKYKHVQLHELQISVTLPLCNCKVYAQVYAHWKLLKSLTCFCSTSKKSMQRMRLYDDHDELRPQQESLKSGCKPTVGPELAGIQQTFEGYARPCGT